MIPHLINTAGEEEREARSRRANAVEVLAFVSWILTVLWPFCFAFGVLPGNKAIRDAGTWPLTAAFFWVLAVSPLWHRDSLQSLGLGNVLHLWKTLRHCPHRARWRLLTPILLLFGALCVVSVSYWAETARMFKLSESARAWPLSPCGMFKLILFSISMSAFVVCCVVRWDNIGTSFRPLLIISAFLLCYTALAAWLNHGPAAFARFDPARYPLDVLAYAFWGTLQQYCFTAYIATRLRKSVPPGLKRVVPNDAVGRAFLAGAIVALPVGAMVWWIVWGGIGEATLVRLIACILFAFPFGAAWMHFYLRDRRRMIVATCAGIFFGLIHVNSYGLVMVTAVLGTVFAYLYMEDCTRNLVAIGFTHGLLGSTFGKFFNSEAAGPLKVGYRVGPWNVEDPTFATLVVPLLCLALCLAALVWAIRTDFFRGYSSRRPRKRPLTSVSPEGAFCAPELSVTSTVRTS